MTVCHRATDCGRILGSTLCIVSSFSVLVVGLQIMAISPLRDRSVRMSGVKFPMHSFFPVAFDGRVCGV